MPNQLIVDENRDEVKLCSTLPLFRNSPNYTRLQNWANSQITPALREIANKIIENINYISFEDFLQQLIIVINDFKLKNNDAPYILLISEDKYSTLLDGCSDLWIANLALEHGLPRPEAIITLNKLMSSPQYLQNFNAQNILILDDAAYSGAQKSMALEYLIVTYYGYDILSKMNLFLGLVYITKHAKENILQTVQDNTEAGTVFNTFTFLEHAHIPSAIDCLDDRQRAYAQSLGIADIDNRHTLTYFDHKFPDFQSTMQQFYKGESLFPLSKVTEFMQLLGFVSNENNLQDGMTLVSDPEEYNEMVFSFLCTNYNKNFAYYNIPRIIPPYHLHMPKILDDLSSAIKNHQVGEIKNSTFPPEIATVIQDSYLQQSAHIEEGVYKGTSLTLEQQQRIDETVLSSYVAPEVEAEQRGEVASAEFGTMLSGTMNNGLLFFQRFIPAANHSMRNMCNIL